MLRTREGFTVESPIVPDFVAEFDETNVHRIGPKIA